MAILMAMLMVRGAGACHVNSWQEQHRMVLAAAKVGAAPKSSTSARCLWAQLGKEKGKDAPAKRKRLRTLRAGPPTSKPAGVSP
eukprot:scaffold97537_cov19-Tisochrysis_lutea.AAC.4